jgi:hypothetical protein
MIKQPTAHERIVGTLEHARIRGGWTDEAVADRVLQELGLDHDGKPLGGDQAADGTGDTPPAEPPPTVVQSSPFQTPIQAPNPAIGPPPDDMIKGVEPASPPEIGKHPPAPADEQASELANEQASKPADEQASKPADEHASKPADEPDEHERRGHRGHDRRDHDRRDQGKK